MSKESIEKLIAKRRTRGYQLHANAGVALPPLPPVGDESVTPPAKTDEKASEVHSAPGADAVDQDTAPTARMDFDKLAKAGIGPLTAMESAPAPLKDEEMTEFNRLLAHEEALSQLKDELHSRLVAARDEKYDLFKCDIDRDKPDLPFVVQFMRHVPEGDKIKTDYMKPPVTLTRHSKVFKEHDVPLTLKDAVDLIWPIEGEIANKGFQWAEKLRRSGTAVMKDDTDLPAEFYDATKYLPSSGIKEHRGQCTLDISIENPLSKKKPGQRPPLTVSFPLGVTRHSYVSPEELQAIDAEGQERADYVRSTLAGIKQKREEEKLFKKTPTRSVGTKSRIVTHLRAWVESQPGKIWEGREQSVPLYVEGFDKQHLLWESPKSEGQKITLGPVTIRREIGQDNPSYIMHMMFYIGDKNKKALGQPVRTRQVRLHTLNEGLAKKRAFESLVGVPNRSGDGFFVTGFLQRLQNYMDRHPEAEWHIVGSEGQVDKVTIGARPLQHFLSEMMRYEHDMGADYSLSQPKDGRVTVTLSAFRGFSPGYGRGLEPPEKPSYKEPLYKEPLCIKSADQKRRVPVAVRFTIPENLAQEDRIAEFAKEVVQDNMRWDIARSYSPVRLSNEEFKDSPHRTDQLYYVQHASEDAEYREPKEYRARTIRKSLFGAVHSNFKNFFGIELPRETLEEMRRIEAEDKAADNGNGHATGNGKENGNGEEAHFRRRISSPLTEDGSGHARHVKRSSGSDKSRLI